MRTPGPWTWKEYSKEEIRIWGSDGANVARLEDSSIKAMKEDADMIAAAPDLLAACEAVFAEFDERMSQEGLQLDSSPKSHYSPGFNAMLLAMKKAKGISNGR